MKLSEIYLAAAELLFKEPGIEYSCNAISLVSCGGTSFDKSRQFYTALYHLYLLSNENPSLGETFATKELKDLYLDENAFERRIWMLLMAAAVSEAEGD